MRDYEDAPRYPWVLWLIIFLVLFVAPTVYYGLGIAGYVVR